MMPGSFAVFRYDHGMDQPWERVSAIQCGGGDEAFEPQMNCVRFGACRGADGSAPAAPLLIASVQYTRHQVASPVPQQKANSERSPIANRTSRVVGASRYKPIAELIDPRSLFACFLYVPIRYRF
jgi:hypothetical protein